MTDLLHKEISKPILEIFYDVYYQLGYGFLEKVYQNAMYLELIEQGYKVEAQKQIKVYYKNKLVGEFYADLLVEDSIILELKACECLVKYPCCTINELFKINTNRSGIGVEFW
ncbi:GxxExxY protein [Flavobacterium pectinovorum]|uniref:GxxExxY protein n=1 Tax=Flavobacterium pectinovorum TaxID=29533 RepID=UPI001F502BA0|nr:GxxExxY protein [Flavobacterium pectinovorum]